jgi:hypothetical protein
MFVALVLAYGGGQVALMAISKHAPAALGSPLAVIAAPLLCAVLLALYVGLIRLFEGRRSPELALRPGARLALAGLLVGVTLFCAVYAVLWAFGVARFEGVNGVAGAAIPLAMAMLAGVGEELIFRGVVFRIVEESCGTLVALAVSAGFFGFAHLSAPGATAVSTLAIALEAGLLLAAAYLLTRNLWFPIGLHMGWNFTEGGVFGSAVSGHAAHGVLIAPISGPAAVTGGAFGPEASPSAVIICLIAAIVFVAIAVTRGQWRAFAFRLYPR